MQVSRWLAMGLVCLLAGCGGGGGGGGGEQTPPPPPVADTTPAAFSFTAQTGSARSAVVASNDIVISDINASAPISITGGEYSIDGGPFTSAAGTVTNNQTIRVRATSSAEFSNTVTVVLTVGGISASFTITTADPDTVANEFQFQRNVNAVRGAWSTSNSVTIAGIDAPTPVSVENGEYSIDGSAFTSTAGSIRPGQALVVRARASITYSQTTVARITVGSIAASFEVTSELPNYVPDAVAFDGHDIVYLLSGDNRVVLRWSLSEERYLQAYAVGSVAGPTTMAYSPAHQRLYLGYSTGTGAINYIDLAAGGNAEVPFTSMGYGVGGLLAVGNYLWAQTANDYYVRFHQTFDRNGTRMGLSDSWWTYYSKEVTWDPVTSRVYHFRDGYSPNNLLYENIDPNTGAISFGAEAPYHGGYNILPPIRVSPNGQQILLGSGDIYNHTNLNWARSIGSLIADARWSADGALVTLSTAGAETTLRRRAATTLAQLEQLKYSGQALRIVGTDAKMAVVLIDNDTVRFQVYVPSDDSDGDGVSNTEDAFPTDAAASVDTDHDGYPDAWNPGRGPGDSPTGLDLDAYPQDAACYLTAHGTNGACNYASTVPNYVPDQVIQNGDIVYLLSIANQRVYRWSIATGAYLDPYVVGIDQGYQTLAPSRMAYSSSHQRLYLGYSTGAIQYINVTSGRAEVPFAAVALSVDGLAAVGNFVLVQDASNFWETHYIFNRNGVITDMDDVSYPSDDYVWDPVNSRAYYLRNGSGGQLHFEVIDQTTGQITARGEPPYYGSYNTPSPIRLSMNGARILVGSGDIYSSNGMTWSTALGAEITDARWFNNGSLVTLSTANNQTTLRRRGANLGPLEQRTYNGRALRVVGSDTRMAVLVVDGDTVRFHIYVPNDDSDGDGVSNTQDAFPFDPAASIDTDRDGYPDSWNAGRGPSDSTTGLTLDAYPQDSACYLSSHGTGSSCNYSANIPNYVPDQIVQNGDTIYLLSTANRRVYRWSIATASYLNPYVVGLDPGYSTIAPTRIAYSSEHQRLYVGYNTGAIQYIDVTSNSSAEIPLAHTPHALVRLVAVGNYLLAQDSNNGSWEAHYIFNSNGVVTARSSWAYYTGEYQWDPASSRVYFVRDNTAPNSLMYEVIDQVTGGISSYGDSLYPYTYNIQRPIRPSTTGQYVLTGNGDLFNGSGLAWAGSVDAPFTDARWFANNSLALLRTANNQTTLRRLSQNMATWDLRTYAGTALRVVGSDTRMAVIVNNGDTVQFHIYEPSNDTDGDGVSNAQDAFPLDASASVDSDRDGYPDTWNAGSGPGDSTTGLSLDAYPQDLECYLPSHGNGVNCNYGATMPNYVADQVITQGDTVYLLSSANRRVYRWSIATRTYLKPYDVRIAQDYNTLSPTKMAYSSNHQRLYLGYGEGAIQYIDLTSNSGALVPFANVTMPLEGIAAAGNYVFAQNRHDNYWATHFVFDRNGVITDQEGYNDTSREYAWDPVNSRLYHFNESLGSNNLRYEVIDQTTGEFGERGMTTQYGGSYTFEPPIRIAADGHTILVGTGDLYVRPNLSRAGTLGKAIKDARWTDYALVDVDATDRVEIRDLNTRDVLASYQYLGTPLALAFGSSEAFLVHVLNGTTTFTRLAFGDQDNDSLPQWWEQLYGFSDSNPADALGDPDGDGVSNVDEYLHRSSPLLTDTDGDGLSDDQEIGTHSTDPSRADTDRDGLNDYDELVTHLTNALVADTDTDGYTDYDEVLYGGNPNDQSSVPQPMSSYTQSFENNPDLSAWSTPDYSSNDWSVDPTIANTGTASLQSGPIANNQASGVRFRGFFTAGELSFYARVDSQDCCNSLMVLVDGVRVTGFGSTNQWYRFSMPITLGVHTIEWRFEKDVYYSPGNSVARIDDVVFVGR